MNDRVVCLNPMLDAAGEDLLRAAGLLVSVVDAADAAAVAQALPAADAVVVRLPAVFGAREIALAGQARVVAASGVGTDHIDVAAATRAGIAVVNNPGAGATAVAEHAAGLMLALAKRIPAAGVLLREAGWTAARERFHGPLMSGDLTGARLGLVGFGLIAASLARIARGGFTMAVTAFARPGREAACREAGVAWSGDLLAVCRDADFLSVHLPYTPDTHHFVGRAAIGAMRPDAYLINTARGGVVDNEALHAALRDGRIAGAGLDVFEPEPLPAGDALLTLANVVATPHVAGISRGACRALALSAAGQIVRALRGERPAHLVDAAGWPPRARAPAA